MFAEKTFKRNHIYNRSAFPIMNHPSSKAVIQEINRRVEHDDYFNSLSGLYDKLRGVVKFKVYKRFVSRSTIFCCRD